MNKIKELRKQKKLTQVQLAKEMGTTSQTILNWENGLHHPNLKKYQKLSSLFGCSIGYLIDEEEHDLSVEEICAMIDKIPFASIVKSYLTKK